MTLDLDKFEEKIQCSLCGKLEKRYTVYVVDDVKICLYCWCKKWRGKISNIIGRFDVGTRIW